ncbi:Lrp/AsnC family transcriptional regulator [Mycetocola tolaasinivorans]|nr:Lrp/AsnC family transcriptional regulator [Mycetocola tolaasinivorans]
MSEVELDGTDRRIIAALQCDPRATVEHLAGVLTLGTRPLRRRLNHLLDSGAVRVVARTPQPARVALMLRIRILSGRLEQLSRALARRTDIAYIDASIGGDELAAVLITESDTAGRLITRQLPETGAIAAVEAHPILHVFSEAKDWRLDALSDHERSALTLPQHPRVEGQPVGERDAAIIDALTLQPRASATWVADRVQAPVSTVRRRLTTLRNTGQLAYEVSVDPARLGLPIDVNFWIRLPPQHLDDVGRALATHPAVHGTLALAGTFSLNVAAWFADLGALYHFMTTVLAEYPIDQIEPIIVGSAIKRPGRHAV